MSRTHISAIRRICDDIDAVYRLSAYSRNLTRKAANALLDQLYEQLNTEVTCLRIYRWSAQDIAAKERV